MKAGDPVAARATAAILFGSTLVGFSAIFVKWAVAGGATALTVGFYRMLFALPGVWMLARRTGTGTATGSFGDRRGRSWALLASVAFFTDLALWHVAMHRTSAANATLLVGLSPLWVALFSFFVLERRLGALGWAGQLAGLVGALVLALARGARGGSTGTGEAIAIAASFCYATFTLILSRARATLSAPQALFWMSVGCLACFAVSGLLTGAPFGGYDARAWASLVGLGIVVQLGGWWLNSWGLGHVEPAFGALGLQMQQVATLFLAAWLLGEPLRPLGLLGGGLLVGGILLVSFRDRRAARRRAS
jgi:drug/metabolite transporter (DMT)-like permease